MTRKIRIGAANLLAAHILILFMHSTAHAYDDGVTLPDFVSDPVTVSFANDAIELDQIIENEVLRVYVGAVDSCCENRTPVAGSYDLTKSSLTFTPAFDFVSGQEYVVRSRLPGSVEKVVSFNIAPKTSLIKARVTEIYPSNNILPENVLRFYLHFSVPMSPQVAFDYIKLRDSQGVADKAAFMKFKQELWNEDRTRLTVLIDPGRIKRDVATNLRLGPALIEGHQYTLSIEKGWPSADGSSVLPAFSKRFTVGKALRKRPSVNLWKVRSPCFGTRDALNVAFDRPFDRYLLFKNIRIVGEDGTRIGGVIHVGEGENSWSFTPHQPWIDKDLHVVASDYLEDVAGNNFHDLLDHSVIAPDHKTPATKMIVKVKNCS